MAEGDAAGDGLAAGLGLVAAGAAVSGAGEADVDDVDGDVVLLGEFVLVVGSVAQPTAKAIARMVGSRRVVRPISFIVGLLISFSSFGQD